MRKLISILFLFLLFGPLTVALSWLHYQKSVIHKEVKKGILSENKEELIPLEFSMDAFKKLNFLRNNEELEYLGELYDIIEIKQTGEKIILLCWHDSKETHINKKLNELYGYILNSHPQRNKTLFHVNLFMKTLYSENPFHIDMAAYSEKTPPYIHVTDQLNDLTFSPPTPPPEFV